MKIGLIARADNGGLGSQTWELYRHLKPAKTLAIDISAMNGYENHFERYPDSERCIGFPTNGTIDDFLDGLDVVFTVETPYSFYLFEAARARGVKTVLQYNYEFLDYLQNPEWAKPDLLLAPSLWHFDEVKARADEWGVEVDYLHVPTNRQLFPFKKRTQAKTFLHIAGHKTYEDRNGTDLVYAAIPLVKSDVKFIIRSQFAINDFADDWRVKVETRDVENYWELQRDEDALLLPRRYGGLSLQLNEALSAGMIPVMSDVSPQNGFLLPEWLIPAQLTKKIFTRTEIGVYDVTPEALAAKIDWLANQPQEIIEAFSGYADIVATERSWETMAPKYINRLEELCKQPSRT